MRYRKDLRDYLKEQWSLGVWPARERFFYPVISFYLGIIDLYLMIQWDIEDIIKILKRERKEKWEKIKKSIKTNRPGYIEAAKEYHDAVRRDF